MKAYSEDQRQKVVQAVQQRGTSKSQAARLFNVSLSSVKRYTTLADLGEFLAPRKGGGRPSHSRRNCKEATRRRHTHKTRCYRLRKAPLPRESFAGKSLGESTIRRLLKRMGFRRKKGLWGCWNETNG
jgi:transposase